MNPQVSIIIPTYNRAEDLKRALQSVFRQTFTNFEVLVMDDGSTDNTREVVERFNDERIKYEWAENFGGPAVPRNRGLKVARGEFIAFLDSDDWWLPKKLEESIKYMDKGADVVYHNLYFVTKPNQGINWRRTRTRKLKKPVFYDLIAEGNTLPNSSVVVRKKLLNEINGFSEDENMIASEDYDAWLRLAQISEKFQRIPQTLGFYWAGGGNISNPDRTLKYVAALEKRYPDMLSDFNTRYKIYWLNYAKGRAYFLLKDYGRAIKYLRLNRWIQAPSIITLKTCWMLLLIQLLPMPRRPLLINRPIEIGLIKSDKAFSPEIEGYLSFFKIYKDIRVSVYGTFQEADEKSDITIVFFGFIPAWKRHKSLIVAEYNSLSVGRLSFAKNILKRLLNIRGAYYIFLNDEVRRNLFFSHKVPHSLRGMGFVEESCKENLIVKKDFDFVYSGAVGRSGVINAILKIGSLGFRVAVIGNSQKEGEFLGRVSDSVYCFGKTSLKRSYEIMASAKYGLNFTPDTFPFNVQDSTKVIEYCALGLGVVTNRYKWVNEFEERIGAKFLSFEAVNSYESVSDFSYEWGDIEKYSWSKVIQESHFMNFIESVMNVEGKS